MNFSLLPSARPPETMTEAAALYEQAAQVGDVRVIVGQLSDAPIEQARTAMDSLKKKAKSAVIVLGMADGEGKVTGIFGLSSDITARKLAE